MKRESRGSDTSSPNDNASAPLTPWVTFQPEIKVLNCTIRDGGLINNHLFSNDFVRNNYQTCIDAEIDDMEIGYKGSTLR